MARRDLGTPLPPTTDVRVHADRVEKAAAQDPRAEASKLRSLHRLGREHGFRAPAVLDVDTTRGVLTLERVRIDTPLVQLLHDPAHRDAPATAAAFREAGRILGVLHQHLDPQVAADDDPVAQAAAGTDAVPEAIAALLEDHEVDRLRAEAAPAPVVSHGDYGTSNLFVDHDGIFTVLDPLPNGYSSFRSIERGSRYLDLALFDSCLLGRGPVRTFISARPRPMVGVLRQFLAGYQAQTGVQVDVELLRTVSRAVLQSYLQRRRNVPAPVAAATAAVAVTRQEPTLMSTSTESYRQSHQRRGYGEFYDETIFAGYFGDVWQHQESPTLRSWLREAASQGAVTAIDMACGTGRISQVLAQEIPSVVGVDVSAEMLTQARRRCPGVRFVERDVTADGIEGLDPADLATAFRFFMNAEPALRAAVLERLHDLLRPGGLLITNVQCNAESPAGLVRRLRHRLLGHDVHTMSHAELTELLAIHGFVVERTAWMAHWPRTGPYLAGLARRMQRPAERVARACRVPERYSAGMFMVRARRV